jgi:alcohol dehydrogenase class IV
MARDDHRIMTPGFRDREHDHAIVFGPGAVELAQTAVRLASLEHAHVNAALLPHTVAAFRRRAPGRLEQIDQAGGTRLEDFAEGLPASHGL